MNGMMDELCCPLCQKSVDAKKKTKLLNGKAVCEKCYYAFANRRQLAFAIDIVLFRILSYGAGILLGIAAMAFGANPSGTSVQSLGQILGWILYLVFLFKDGFKGCSPGKTITGVQVIHLKKNAAGGFLDSFKRNFLILIPLVPIVIAFQLCKGDRWGDGIASTRVIWKKYKDAEPFLFSAQ